MTRRNSTSAIAALGIFLAAQGPTISEGQGNPNIPDIESVGVVKVVDPFNAEPAQRLYGTLDMMDLVEAQGRKIMVIAHEIFPSSTQGSAGNLPGFPLGSPDTYDGVNRGLGLGAVTGWDQKTGEFFFIVPPKNTALAEPYDENQHTSATDGVRATPWGTALIGEEWSQSPSIVFGTPARGGHILEVNPLDPGGSLSRVKVMGSFSHEGIAIQKTSNNYVIYQGDELRGGGTWAGVPPVAGFACANDTPRRGGAVYRFIPSQKPKAFNDLQANGGTLQAFDFLVKEWVTVPNSVVAAENPDVIRCWADTTLSHVSLWERPEDIEYDEISGHLYIAVTERSCVVAAGQCTATLFDGNAPNRSLGHVIRLNPDTGDWSVFVDADTVNAAIPDPKFGNPDNLVLDREGRVYITQDGGTPNDSIWIATPDKNHDGVADTFARFLNMADANLGVPASCGEPTGFHFVDEKTLLFNFQGGARQNDFGVVQDAACPLFNSRIMAIELGGTDH
jgi:hypothetical protein